MITEAVDKCFFDRITSDSDAELVVQSVHFHTGLSENSMCGASLVF